MLSQLAETKLNAFDFQMVGFNIRSGGVGDAAKAFRIFKVHSS